MDQKGKIDMQNNFISAMIKNLPVLRAAIHLTQASLADKLGVSRQTIVAIETRKREMPWNLYLALVCVFQQYPESCDLLDKLGLFTSCVITEVL